MVLKKKMASDPNELDSLQSDYNLYKYYRRKEVVSSNTITIPLLIDGSYKNTDTLIHAIIYLYNLLSPTIKNTSWIGYFAVSKNSSTKAVMLNCGGATENLVQSVNLINDDKDLEITFNSVSNYIILYKPIRVA